MPRDFRDQKEFKDYYEERRLGRQLFLLQVLLTAGILLLFGRFWFLQVIEGSFYGGLSERNHFRLVQELPLRGGIQDRQGREFAGNRVSLNVYLDREKARDLSQDLERVSRVLRLEPGVMENRLEQAKSRPAFQPVLLKEDVGLAEAAFFESRRSDFPALHLRTEALRFYPAISLAAHLLGYVGEASTAEIKQNLRADIRLADIVGKAGVERTYEGRLAGARGFKKILVNSLGREIEVLETVTPPTHGSSLRLTLDMDMQKDLEAAFAGRMGSGVFMDPYTGEVLAMTSQPAFDPNLFASRFSQGSWNDLVTDPRHPLQNRTIQSKYPPASVFKLVLALGALEEGIAIPSRTDTCTGSAVLHRKRFHCHKRQGHGTLDLREAIQFSCNVYFYRLGQEMGVERIARWARRFGFGSVTGIDLPHEVSGTVPDAEWKRRIFGEPWYPGETISISTGQGALEVTPLQMVRFMAAIANGGTLVRPHVVRRPAAGGTGEPVGEANRVALGATTLKVIHEALWDVVNDGGTGWRAAIAGRGVSGKTGTAQLTRISASVKSEDLPEEIRDHSWFVGYAPGDRPQVAFAIIVEHGGHGGVMAAPLAREVLDGFFRRQGSEEAEADVRKASLD